MEETPAPGRFEERISPDMLLAFRRLLMIGGMAARALWRSPPDAVPQLRPLVAALEDLTGLTAADGEALYACIQSPDAMAREAMMRPGRFYLFIAVGLAACESALVGSPLLPLTLGASGLAATNEMAEAVYKVIESTENGEVADLPLDFDPFAHGHDPFGEPAAAGETAETTARDDDDDDDDDNPDDDDHRAFRIYSVDELRLIRWQLGTLFTHHEAALQQVVLADCVVYTPNAAAGPDPADDPANDDFYHDRRLGITINIVLRGIAIACLITSAYWFLSAAVPFARAAARLRWLRRRAAIDELMQHLNALDYPDDDTGTPPTVRLSLSLAEMLTLYQAQESVALALLNGEVLAAVEALSPSQPPPVDDDDAPGNGWLNHIRWLRHELEVSSDLGRMFLHNVSLLGGLMQQHLTGDAAAAFAEARAEVAALAELAASPGAV